MVRRITLAALLAASACTFPEQPLPPGDRRVVVHAVLDASRSVQVVAISMSDGSEVNPGDLDDAEVIITTPDGVQLTARQDTASDPHDPFRPEHYRIDLQAAGHALIPGGTYQLRVTTRLGEVITGATTIPQAIPVALAPLAQFTRLSDTLGLEWAPVTGARTYEVQVWQRYPYVGAMPNLQHIEFTDHGLRLPGTNKSFDQDVFVAETRAFVYVLAVDANYYEYYRLLADPLIGAPPSRLSGGLGVFGSVVPVVRLQLDVK